MRYLIATGGTGGHIYPALALANEIKKIEPDSSILFVGSADRMEAQEVPHAGYRFSPIQVSGMNGGPFHKLLSSWRLFRAYQACIQLIKKEKPDIVLGFGNYISVPVILAAHRAHLPTMLHEQNSYAGKANRFLSRFADAVVGCYEENRSQFPSDKIRILGNPRASEAAKVQRNPKLVRQLGLDPNRPLVIIVMGSLGSQSVNEVMKGALKMMAGKPYQVLYVTGRSHYEEFSSDIALAENLRVVPYIDGCNMMINATLCVVRGGATTAAEMTAMRMPSIIIPSPYVPNNHQVKNAQALAAKKAAVMIEEKDLTEQAIVSKIEDILENPIQLREMSVQAGLCGRPDACENILTWIQELKGMRK